MKYYTQPLVDEVKQKKRFSSFFLGDYRRTSYYEATHREDGTYLLWIEGINWGKVICYPCVMIQGSETLVYENGTLDISKENNAQLIRRWNDVADPRTIREDFELRELEKQEFHTVFARYRKMHIDWAIAQAEAEQAEVRGAAQEDAQEDGQQEEQA